MALYTSDEPTSFDSPAWFDGSVGDPQIKPAVCGVVDEPAEKLDQSHLFFRTDRLRALGNAVVPIVAALAFCVLQRRLMD